MIYRYPVNYIAITQPYIPNKHYGLDLGWSRNHGGPNQPVYAAADGLVVAIKDNDTSGKSWGNYIKIQHADGSYTLYAHLKTDSLKVTVGDSVVMGEQIACMGDTGDSKGNHLHFEIYIGGSSTKYRVDPLLLTYVFPDQITSQGETKDLVKYYNPEEPAIPEETEEPVTPEEPVIPEAPKYKYPVGTRVKITGQGNASSYGTGNTARGIGWVRYVTAIHEGRPYPYQVGNKGSTRSKDTTGFYKEVSLKEV